MSKVSKLGYSKGSPYRNNPYLDIETPEGLIDMSNTDIPLLGIDNTGYSKVMNPYSGTHEFLGDIVREIPLAQKGGISKAKLYSYLFDDIDEPRELDQPTAPSDDELSDYKDKIGEQERTTRDLQRQLVNQEDDELSLSLAAIVQEETLGNPYSTRNSFTNSNFEDEQPSSGSPVGFGFSDRIGRTESAMTGQPTSLNSSAIGRGQMIKGTRQAMYRKLGISDNNFAMAETLFKTDPNFEDRVINAYREELSSKIPSYIQGVQREYMIAKGWYTGDPFYPDDKVPHPEAGNRITARQYAIKYLKQR